MSSTGAGVPQDRRLQNEQMVGGQAIVFTEEETRVLKECEYESFFYRSVPFSVVGMAVTQALIARGVLTVSPRFGSLPKVFAAAVFGYFAGKVSYMTTCKEKFLKLENSQVADRIRQLQRGRSPAPPPSELSDPDTQSFGSMFQAAEPPPSTSTPTGDSGFISDSQAGKMENFRAPSQSYLDEEEPQKKPILYEDLRLKNRENYEVTLTQKTDPVKGPPQWQPEKPKIQVKKNIYGDTWEE